MEQKGYIIVRNSVTGKSELVRLEEGMKYMPSAILFEKLEKKIKDLIIQQKSLDKWILK